MPVYQGTYYTKTLLFTDADTGAAIDISGRTYEMDIRDAVTDTDPELTLTTANGGLTVTNGAGGALQIAITAVQSAALPLGKMVFDILRTDSSPGPTWVCSGSFKVKQPVTR